MNTYGTRFLSAFLIAAALIPLCCSACAAGTTAAPVAPGTDVPYGEMIATLVERGYPQAYLECTAPSVVESLYHNPDLEFAGAKITTFDRKTGDHADYEFEPGAAVSGQIPAKDLTLSWSFSQSIQNRNEYTVNYSYEWTSLPVWRWQDPIAVSWDAAKFRMKDDSFYKVDQYDGHNAVNPMVQFTGRIQSEEYGYANGGPGGVSWYADLKGYWEGTVTRLYGHGEFVLEKLVAGSGSSVVYGHYVHPTATVFAAINAGSGYDDWGSQSTLRY